MFLDENQKNSAGILFYKYLLSFHFFYMYSSYIIYRKGDDCFHHFIENSLKSPSAFPECHTNVLIKRSGELFQQVPGSEDRAGTILQKLEAKSS